MTVTWSGNARSRSGGLAGSGGRRRSGSGGRRAGARRAACLLAGCLTAGGLAGLAVPGIATAGPTTLFAAPSAVGSGTCLTAADACTLGTALSQVAAGGTIRLITAGSSSTTTLYRGGFTVATSGTSATDPVTIEPAAGVVDPILDGINGDPVLSVTDAMFLHVTGVTIEHGGLIDSGEGASSTTPAARSPSDPPPSRRTNRMKVEPFSTGTAATPMAPAARPP